MKKLISMLLALATLVSLIAVMPASAADEVLPAGTVDEVLYKSIDLSPYATGKFWIDSDDDTEGYRTYADGLFHENNRRVIAEWPLGLRGGDQRTDDAYPAQNAIVHSGSTAKITSTKTGITYTLPPKAATADEKEAILLAGYYTWVPSSQTITVDGKYSALNFLVATAAKDGVSTTIAADVSYTDGTKAQLPATAIPVAHKNGQESDNFVADINRWASEGKNAYTVKFANDDPSNLIIALYEYSLELDSNKTVSSITFTHGGVASAAIAGVTMTGGSATKSVYTQHDLSAVANGKFWVTPDEYNASYVRADFASTNSVTKLAAYWPMEFRTASRAAETYPAQNGVITGDATTGFTLTSKSTNVPYKMPAKTGTVDEKEAIVLNKYRTDEGRDTCIREKSMSISGNYDKLHFLIGIWKVGNTEADITATVTYTNGDTVVKQTGNIPDSTPEGQKAATNFVADLRNAGSDSTTGLSGGYNGEWASQRCLAFYEYSIDLDPTKTVSKIHFLAGQNSSWDSDENIVIASVVTEAVVADTDVNNGYVYTDATVTEGAVAAEVCAPVGGKAILAVYDATTKALVAVGSADLTAGALGKTVTASSEAITADGSYEIKLFLWEDYSSLEPVYEAVILD